MKGFYLLLLILLSVGIQAQTKKLVILGSSTSACTGPSSFANCYVAKLDAYFDGIGRPIDIVQLAVGGYNPYKGMPTSYTPSGLPGPYDYNPDPNNNITKAVSLNPDAILVNYPTNAFDALTIGQIMYALRTIRDSGAKAGIPVFITTSQPRNAAPFDTFAARQKLKEVRDSVLAQFGNHAINFWDGLADPTTYEIIPTYNADNIHLNDAGHDILFQRVRDSPVFVAELLPVKLRSFNATQQQGAVNISWTVADEEPGTRYELQRSADGANFKTIQTFTSANASANRSYNATDPGAAAGINYYRLKVVENAKTFFSQVVKLSLAKNKLSLKTFSVDGAQLVIKLNAAENIHLQLNFLNSTGQLVQKNTQLLQPGENRVSFSLNNLPAGTYWAEAIADKQKIFTKGFRVY